MSEKFSCDQCGKEFDSERGLHIHQSQVHAGEEDSDEESNVNGDTKETDATHKGGEITLRLGSLWALGAVFVAGMLLGGIVIGTIGNNSPADNIGPSQVDNSVEGNQNNPEETFRSIANDVGLNPDQLMQCVNNKNNSEFTEGIQQLREGDSEGFGTPTFYIGNNEIGFVKVEGAQTYSTLEQILDREIARAQSSPGNSSEERLKFSDNIDEGEPKLGSSDAPIQMIEVTDFGCPWCAEWAGYEAIPQRNIDQTDTLSKIKSNYVETGEVELVVKDYPAHPNAPEAHKAANCAWETDEDSYWEFHDQLFERRNEWMQ